MTSCLPVYTETYLRSLIPEFFQKVSQYRNGKPKTLIGRIKPDQVRELSYFVVKIWHRKPRQVKALQKSRPGERNNIYWRTYWAHSHCTYGIYSIKWHDGELTQLDEHATKAAALAVLASY